MNTYLFADLRISSSVVLPELRESGRPLTPVSEVFFSLADVRAPEQPPEVADQLGPPVTDDARLSVTRTADGLILSFPSLAEFVVSEACDRITASPCPGCSMLTVRHLLLDQVLPRVIAHRGRIVLHASAVTVAGSAVAFAGPSGCGKSTLAASLHASGFPALTDDGLIVTPDGNDFTAQALYPGLRLWPSSIAAVVPEMKGGALMARYSAKRRLPFTNPDTSSPRPLAAVFILAEPPVDRSPRPVTISRRSARDTCMEIIRSSFHLDLSDTSRAARALDAAADLVQSVPTFELSHPHDYSTLPEVQEAILSILESLIDPGEGTATGAAGLS